MSRSRNHQLLYEQRSQGGSRSVLKTDGGRRRCVVSPGLFPNFSCNSAPRTTRRAPPSPPRKCLTLAVPVVAYSPPQSPEVPIIPVLQVTSDHLLVSSSFLLEIEGLWPHLMRDVRVRDVPMRDVPAPVGRTGDVRTSGKAAHAKKTLSHTCLFSLFPFCFLSHFVSGSSFFSLLAWLLS